MKVAVYDLYWSTYGGGEQVDAAIAECLVRAGHDVTLLGPEPVDIDETQRRLGRDLSGCSYRRVTNDDEASEASTDVDLFVNGTYLSTAQNRAAAGLYYVHFPEVPGGRRQQITRRIAAIGHRTLSRWNELPSALAGVRNGLDRRRHDQSWVASYSVICANSAFTAGWVETLWRCQTEVLYPPVAQIAAPADGARHDIISVGRFFDRQYGHCKKQDVLLNAFIAEEDTRLQSARLHLVGGADAASRDYVLGLRRAALGHRVDVRVNVDRADVVERLSTAGVFWHAGGFGEDPETDPDRCEHFGIAVVEAMSAGCVPVVYAAAGPAEIVRNGIDGLQWSTTEELIEISHELLNDPQRWKTLSVAARARATEFDVAAFDARLQALVRRYC